MGKDGREWMQGLDDCVEHLKSLWQIETGDVRRGGSESLVLDAIRADGSEAIVKIGLPGSSDLSNEARVLKLGAGRGYADLLAEDSASNAILIERLGLPLSRRVASTGMQMRLICRTLRQSWLPLGSDNGLMTGADKARWLANFITEKWQSLDRPCEKKTIDRALEFAGEREAAFSTNSCVLVHGDAHADNTLVAVDAAREEEILCKFIDPDGLYAERACDLASLMRDWSPELLAGDTVALARERCSLLAGLTDEGEPAIWQWGYVERVSTGLMMLDIGMEIEARQTLAVADRLSRVQGGRT